MTLPNEALRLGCVKYLNARPLIYGWPGPVDFDHPAALCRKLARGELDAAFVSSFEFLRHPSYAIVDWVAVGSNGPVHSVFVAHRGDLAAIDEIMLDPASLTSVNLLRCLLAENNLSPRLAPFEAGRQISEAAARLIIGDQALRFRQQHGDTYSYWDLGEAWKRATGLPFVFALWLVRPQIKNAAVLADSLRELRDQNLQRLDRLIVHEKEFSPEFCARYFREYLRFDFGEREKEGLLRFHSLCRKHGILSGDQPELRLV